MKTPPQSLAGLGACGLACGLAVALGCGGSPRTEAATGAEVVDRDDELPLGPRLTIPGTGVSLSAPAGARLLPMGPGLVVGELDMTLMVAMAVGPESVHEAFRRELFVDGTDAHTTEVSIQGRAGTLGRDVLPGPNGALPRMWLIARDGERSLALLALYARRGADRADADAIDDLVQRSLSSVHWDPRHGLEPEAAIGVTVGEIEALAIDRTTIGTLALTHAGTRFPPPPGEPMAFVLPVAEQTPESVDLAACAAILERAGPITTGDAAPTLIDREDGWGCERVGEHASGGGPPLGAYAAIRFLSPGPVLLTGMSRPEEIETWVPRFSAAARRLRYLRAPPE